MNWIEILKDEKELEKIKEEKKYGILGKDMVFLGKGRSYIVIVDV